MRESIIQNSSFEEQNNCGAEFLRIASQWTDLLNIFSTNSEEIEVKTELVISGINKQYLAEMLLTLTDISRSYSKTFTGQKASYDKKINVFAYQLLKEKLGNRNIISELHELETMYYQEAKARLEFQYKIKPLENNYSSPSAIHPETSENSPSTADAAFRAGADLIRLQFPIHNLTPGFVEMKLREGILNGVKAKNNLLEHFSAVKLSALAKMALIKGSFSPKGKK